MERDGSSYGPVSDDEWECYLSRPKLGQLCLAHVCLAIWFEDENILAPTLEDESCGGFCVGFFCLSQTTGILSESFMPCLRVYNSHPSGEYHPDTRTPTANVSSHLYYISHFGGLSLPLSRAWYVALTGLLY